IAGSYDQEDDVNSYYIQDQQTLAEELFLTVGLRHDNYTTFGGETTYRGTLAYRLKELGGRLHSSYGTGFKAPSFNELFFPGFGNPNLEEETSWSADVGYEQTLAGGEVTFDVTLFYAEYEDLIVFDTETFMPV